MIELLTAFGKLSRHVSYMPKWELPKMEARKQTPKLKTFIGTSPKRGPSFLEPPR